jgi:hypothetical protein
MKMHNKKVTKLELGDLPQRKVSLGVPLTENGSILLGSLARRSLLNSRIVVSRKEGSLLVCRRDGEPIQIGRVFPVNRYEAAVVGSVPIMGLRNVLKKPLAALVLHPEGENNWLFEGELRDPEKGPDDLRKFFNKIASVSLAKQRCKYTLAN